MSVQMTTGSITAQDGIRLHTVSWIPDSPRAGVVLAHGYGEHSGRYTHVAEALAGRGYAVFAIDHRAHGRSGGEPRALMPPFDIITADLDQFVRGVKAQHTLPRWFILGHSMGGLITWGYAVRHPDVFDGLISSGAAINADANVPAALVTIANLLDRVAPALALVDAAPLAELASNPEIAPAFAADPLNYKGKMRVRTGVSINNEAKFVRSHLHEVTRPALLLYGEDDRIVNPSGSKLAYEQIRSTDKRIIGYPGMKHEIMNERDRAVVLNDILAWLDAHA